MAINFQHYLQSICNYDKYSFWHLYTSTEALDRQRVTSKTRRKCLELVLMVQTIQLQRKGEAPDKEKIERLEVLTGLKKYAANHVLLVGKPGSGKSTALKRLLWEEAQHRKLNYIPVLVELRQYQTTVLDLIQNFLQRHHLHLATAKIEKLLNEGRFLLLVDGVNELPNRKARLDLDKFRQNHPKTPMIFTIRDLGVAGDLGIEKKLEMQPLTAEQMQQFVCAHLPDKGEDMLRQLGGRLKEMGERPLLLLMLCKVFKDNDSLPSNLGEIFRKYTKYYDSKIKEDVPVTAESRERWSLLLQHLAFTMMQGNSQTQLQLSISKNEADDILTEFLKAKNFDKPRECSFSWLKDLLNHHLIQLTNDGQIEFCHQLLQEYYTAECLLMQLNTISDAKLKRDYLNYLKWTEPLALMLALVDDTAQAVRVVKLALEVDLMLGARLAGEVKREFQEQTVRLILNLDVKRCIKSYLLVLAGSECGIDFLIESLGNKDDVVRSSALEVLEKIGNYQAVSVLIATLQHENSYLRWSAAQALGNIGNYQAVPALIAALQDEYYDVRWSAAQALGNIGNYQAVPALIAALQDEDDDVSWSAADALGNISNDQAVTALIAALQHEDDDVRWRATDALGNIGNDQAVPALIAALQDEDDDVSWRAAYALGNIGNDQAVPALIHALQNENSSVRSSAADALGKIGNDQALPALIAALRHEDSHMRWSAADALGKIGNDQAVPALITALQDEDDDVSWRATDALGKIGNDQVVPALIAALQDKYFLVRSSAADALGKIGNDQAVPALIAALQDEYYDVSWRAAYALGNIGNDQAVPALIHALQNENSSVRSSAADALGKIGNDQAVTALIASVRDKDFRVCSSAAQALGKIGNDQALLALIHALQDENSHLRRNAAYALGKIRNDQAVSALIAALQHKDSSVRSGAAYALGKIGNDQAVPALIAALQQEDSHMRSSAADALENISNHQAVTALIASVRDEDSHVRSSAADALGKIGNDQAVLALIAALQHEDSHVRSSAADALENIGKSEIIDQIWEVYKQAPSTDNRDIILKIQRSCNFYNYKLFRSPPIVEDNQSDPLLNTLNKLNQTMSGISETPKYDLRGAIVGNFADKVESGAKLQAIQHIHIPEQRQNIASAAKEIQELLAQLAQTNPSIVESQDSNTIEAAIKAEIQRNTTVKSRLRNALKQGTTEALKQALDAFFKNPFVSISVETIKGFIEAE